MLFNSLDFLIFFPVVTLLYFVIPARWRYLWLLAASYYFYMCWNPQYALLMLTSTAITYASGLLLRRAEGIADEGKRQRRKKLWVGLSFGSNLLILCTFKYLTFLLESLARALGILGVGMAVPQIDLLLPVGISFYTLQALSYTMDVYRGDVEAEPNFLRYALFVSFFPQLVAGPIERSSALLGQLKEHHRFDYLRVRKGLLRMIWGLFQKLVIADRIALLVDEVFSNPAQQSGAAVVVAVSLFCFQIYCDFDGYSNIAIGASQVMGIKLMENFRQPYLSVSIRDYWRRWHISLSTWLRDYLYFPLGGSRKGKGRTIVNTMIIFLVSGLWHGAGWHYIIWGAMHGVYQSLGMVTTPIRKRIRAALHIKEEGRLHRCTAIVITFALLALAFIVFRANTMTDAVTLLRAVFFDLRPASLLGGGLFQLGLDKKDLLVAVVGVLVLIATDLFREKRCLWQWVEERCLAVRWVVYLALIFAVLIFGVYGPNYETSAFIYFAF